MDFNTLDVIFVCSVYMAAIFPAFLFFWSSFKISIRMLWIGEIDLEEYAKKKKDRDIVITPNYLENILYFVGTILMVLGFTFWILLQFENPYIFLVALNELLSAKVVFMIGFNWTLGAQNLLFLRKVQYCQVKKKKNI